ncbi:MAG TPA: hypothetical protein VF928_07860 [Usitatibacteraceae bacterium]
MDTVAAFAFYSFLRLSHIFGMQSVIDLFGNDASHCVYSTWTTAPVAGLDHGCHGYVWWGFGLIFLWLTLSFFFCAGSEGHGAIGGHDQRRS